MLGGGTRLGAVCLVMAAKERGRRGLTFFDPVIGSERSTKFTRRWSTKSNVKNQLTKEFRESPGR